MNWSSQFIEENYQYGYIFKEVNLKKKTYSKTHVNKSKKFKFRIFNAENKFTVLHSSFIKTRHQPLSPIQKIKPQALPSVLVKNKKELIFILSEKAVGLDSLLKSTKTGLNNENISEELRRKLLSTSAYYTYLYRKMYIMTTTTAPKNKRNHANLLYSQVLVNFIRKERLYTKLKYSRSPAYDIVSGGAAALLAGFLGFLISEKFGFELVDSGDFYYLLMYIVFLSFSLKPLLHSINYKLSLGEIFSLKFVIEYYLSLIRFFFGKL
jgi:hypothetical protein